MVGTIYHCSNADCSFRIRLLAGLPVWRTDTPATLAKVPVGAINKPYVVGYADQRFCTACGDIVEVKTGIESCSTCGGVRTFLETGNACPGCKAGVIELVRGAVF